jgi:hypothetical protein
MKVEDSAIYRRLEYVLHKEIPEVNTERIMEIIKPLIESNLNMQDKIIQMHLMDTHQILMIKDNDKIIDYNETLV